MATCYNKGCGQKFDESINKEDACVYHPGAPYFHDAYKIWSCCQKKSTDFTTWLSLPGCTKGPHNPVKPVIESSPPKDPDNAQTTKENSPSVTVGGGAPIKATPRSNKVEPMKTLKLECTDSVRSTAKTKEEEYKQKMAASASGETGDAEEIPIGTNCKHNACSATYGGADMAHDVCVHHPGVPVFHEGMKYWSCCQRKTSEFDAFMSQEGCARGEHLWKQSAESAAKASQCRHEWFQTGNLVTVTVYAKGALPDRTNFEISELSLAGHITYGYGDSVFPFNLSLWRRIDPDKSSVTITNAKVELKLVKAEPGAWARLEFDKSKDS